MPESERVGLLQCRQRLRKRAIAPVGAVEPRYERLLVLIVNTDQILSVPQQVIWPDKSRAEACTHILRERAASVLQLHLSVISHVIPFLPECWQPPSE